MSNEIAIRSNVPDNHEMMVYHTMAETAVSSKMYKGIGEKAGVMMIMLSARELGISPMQALNGGLNIINGKVEISARMMNALIRKAGHTIKVIENSDISCTLEGRRCDTNESETVSFTLADATKAGLVKPGGGWTKWPKDMCFARALSRLSRHLFADVIGMGYVEGEIRASDARVVEGVVEEAEIKPTASMEAILSKFPQEDHKLVAEYLNAIAKHFGWTSDECIEKMTNEDMIVEKFNLWKAKMYPKPEDWGNPITA